MLFRSESGTGQLSSIVDHLPLNKRQPHTISIDPTCTHTANIRLSIDDHADLLGLVRRKYSLVSEPTGVVSFAQRSVPKVPPVNENFVLHLPSRLGFSSDSVVSTSAHQNIESNPKTSRQNSVVDVPPRGLRADII